MAINNSFVTSRLVQQCIASLNALGSHAHVLLRYVKAHCGHEGNEMADRLAKLAVSQPTPYQGPLLPLSKSHYKAYINEAIYQLWTTRWKNYPACQTKCWFPDISPAKSKFLLSQPRDILSRAVRFLTGHCFLRRQRILTKMPAPSIYCRYCGNAPERAIHILTECPFFQPYRITHLGTPTLSPTAPLWLPRNLLALLACPRISDMEKDE